MVLTPENKLFLSKNRRFIKNLLYFSSMNVRRRETRAVEDKKALEKAKKAALKSIVELTKEDASMYYLPLTIARGCPVDHDSYGIIRSGDIYELLEDYAAKGLVDKVVIRHNSGRGNFTGYLANLEKQEALDEILAQK